MPRVELGVKQNYEQQSPEQIRSIQARYQTALKEAEQRLQSIPLWLDIGPNRGFGLTALERVQGSVIAVDIDRNYLGEALQKNDFVHGAQMDACHLGLPGNIFTVVSMFEVIEHVSETDQHLMISEAVRVLQPGGLLFLSTPNKDASGRRRMSPDHKRELTIGEVQALVRSSGLEILNTLGEGFFKDGNAWHTMFRHLRENPVATYIYYHLLPWSIRSKIRDQTTRSQDAINIRPAKDDETPRLTYIIAQKANSESHHSSEV